MRKIARPELVARDVFVTCISNIADNDLQNRLRACEELVVTASTEFGTKVLPPTLHTINRETVINGNVSYQELNKVYTQWMVPKTSPGRAIYEELRDVTKLAKCPLCSQRKVSTLDHHLSKTEYPILSVTPLNLVPSCTDCNKAKLAKYPKCAEEETLHPYFDDIENIKWLEAEVIQTSPPAVRYFVSKAPEIEVVLQKRIENHFLVLSLADLYSWEAGEEMSEIRHQLSSLYKAGGVKDVRAHLLEEEETRSKVNLNSWKAVMYRTLANDEWYCEKGWE
jgi:hypothetical protein